MSTRHKFGSLATLVIHYSHNQRAQTNPEVYFVATLMNIIKTCEILQIKLILGLVNSKLEDQSKDNGENIRVAQPSPNLRPPLWPRPSLRRYC